MVECCAADTFTEIGQRSKREIEREREREQKRESEIERKRGRTADVLFLLILFTLRSMIAFPSNLCALGNAVDVMVFAFVLA